MGRPRKLTARALSGLDNAERIIRFVETLALREGSRAGQQIRLAPFQKSFVRGAFADENHIGVLSVARGAGKSALAAGAGLAALVGVSDTQARREICVASRTKEQSKNVWQFAEGLALSLPDDIRNRLRFRRSPRLEIELGADDGPHILRAVPADGRSLLGGAPVLAIFDERAHWEKDRGDALEAAILTGLGKRSGRALIISTSGPDDANTFSRWIDAPPPGCFVQEHRPPVGLPADDRESLLLANPGAPFGIGASIEWLEASARRAIARGGNALSSFRNLNRNERVSGETRDLLVTVDQWMLCEAASLPPRAGPVIVGLDLGGSASMSAAAFYWPETDRFEAYGTFPGDPSLLDRGQADGVGNRYVAMQERGELATLGAKTVPVAEWIGATMRRIEGEQVAAILADRFKQAEIGEALTKAGVGAPVIWRGMGFRDGGEDCERFRRAVFDGKVKSAESLLMRSVLADTVCLRDPANNLKLAKARSTGRIDAAAAAVLAVAEGARRQARPAPKPLRVLWA